ncbi:MAG: DUF4282 domain-containing protein [Candidatus Cloacimonetes bacterium]|nr:DUF4282 domain-containing protein [Candidatus Cloacimonadota bacterium]
MENNNSFFSTLFDFSFSEFITIKIVKVLFIIGIILAIIGAITFIVAGFNLSTVAGIVFLLISPIIFLLYILLIRVWLEIIIVIFRIADNTKIMAGK